MIRSLALALVLASCGGGSSPPMPDAAKLTNQPFGAMCTVVSDMSTECTSGICTDSFNQTTALCSQKCTMLQMTDPTCPMGSQGQKCNLKGYCRP